MIWAGPGVGSGVGSGTGSRSGIGSWSTSDFFSGHVFLLWPDFLQTEQGI
jgi:hypothetical protein